MTSVHLAVTAVEVWTRLYTWPLSADVRDRRRREVASDLWESLHDAPGPPSALHLGSRLLTGVLDDVGWLCEQRRHRDRRRVRSCITVACALTGSVWLTLGAPNVQMPPLPGPPPRHVEPRIYPDPPPPPPPPCVPPGLGIPAVSPCTP